MNGKGASRSCPEWATAWPPWESNVKDSIKAALVPGMLFEELGFTYVGVIDGHDIEALRASIKRSLAVDGPVLLHCRTVKGKGYAPAETTAWPLSRHSTLLGAHRRVPGSRRSDHVHSCLWRGRWLSWPAPTTGS